MRQLRKKSVLQKKQITFVKHTLQWFLNNLGKSIFYRFYFLDKWQRVYIKIESDSQARQLYVHQNVSGKRYFL